MDCCEVNWVFLELLTLVISIPGNWNLASRKCEYRRSLKSRIIGRKSQRLQKGNILRRMLLYAPNASVSSFTQNRAELTFLLEGRVTAAYWDVVIIEVE
jgi:hypothetical protein